MFQKECEIWQACDYLLAMGKKARKTTGDRSVAAGMQAAYAKPLRKEQLEAILKLYLYRS